MVGSFITLTSVGAWRWFEANTSWMGDHAHHHASAAGGEVHGADGHHHHHAPDSKMVAISLEPGKESMLIVRFEKAEQLQMACLVPGHYESGMRGLVTVGQRS